MNKTHLILHCDALSLSDVNTFRAAANTLERDYRRHYGATGDNVSVQKATSGEKIRDIVAGFAVGSIVSLDIVSHGNQGGIHIARALPQPIEAGLIQRTMHTTLRRHRIDTAPPQTAEDARMIEESMEGLYSNWRAKVGVGYFYNQTYDGTKAAVLSDLDFGRFHPECFAEFHGCKTAEFIPGLNEFFIDNFAKQFSDQLGPNGVTVGHIVNAAPDKNPNKNENDYRYGKVRVYRGGNLESDGVERWGLKFANSSTP
ncbi:MAG: hypothetical protein HKM95_12965 [Inquilinus sp.]|nr:hypothetical protein [Inquilinus sp.]